jgi:hemoglobin
MSERNSPTPSLYQWAGGQAAFRRLIDCFYDRVERDELISPFFPGGVSEQHRAHVTAWWSEVLGGPAR